MDMLFKEIFIGNCRIKNRIALPPMSMKFGDTTGDGGEHLIRYFEERAKGGCGLIITEMCRIDNDLGGIWATRQMDMTDAANVSRIRDLIDVIHSHDCKVFMQFQHSGNRAEPELNGGVIYGAGDIPGNTGIKPIPLTTEQVELMVKKFAVAAFNAKKAGADGVEIHAAHGYLIHQFMSALFNNRTDKYGGCIENRARFGVEIIKAIKEACGRDYPVSVRISGETFDFEHEGAIHIEEAIQFAKMYEAAGADCINVSADNHWTTNACIEPVGYAQGWRKEYTKKIKEAVSVPVIGTNNIKDPYFADSLLKEGYCDMVCVGRPQLADPQWAKKAKEGRVEDIRNCISCLRCIEEQVWKGACVCSVNPQFGRETIFNDTNMKINGNGRAIAVVGGGIAGMEAATILARRGFDVTLFEKSDKLGGSASITVKLADYKYRIGNLIKTMGREMEAAGVKVILNTEATPKLVKELNPCAVFVAVGANPIIPPIEGINGKNVFLAAAVVGGDVKPTGKAVVIGSGQTGIEACEKMYQYDPEKDISLIEMQDQIGPGLWPNVLKDELSRIVPHGVKLMPKHKLLKIAENGVYVQNTETSEEIFIDAESVVLSLGVKPDSKVVESYYEAFDRVIVLGDAIVGGRIGDATRTGFISAFNFEP